MISSLRLRCIALVPSGGSGSRLGASVPKQYLSLNGNTVLHHTLAALSEVAAIEHSFIGAQADDAFATESAAAFGCVTVLPTGGATRAETVLQTLESIQSQVERNAWVLVHDAARPCVNPRNVDAMIDALRNHPVGGLLAIAVTDTVKRVNANREVIETVDRATLWRAQTPQMFRYETLVHALRAAPEATDEAQAIEAIGLAPKIIAGSPDNLKITFPEDLETAQRILKNRL